jgi:hypothetical protein
MERRRKSVDDDVDGKDANAEPGPFAALENAKGACEHPERGVQVHQVTKYQFLHFILSLLAEFRHICSKFALTFFLPSAGE